MRRLLKQGWLLSWGRKSQQRQQRKKGQQRQHQQQQQRQQRVWQAFVEV
jgi:hypothetical protein